MIVAAIGGIGLPEALPCLDSIIKTLSNKSDPSVKCMSVWSLGRLACLKTIKASTKVMQQVLQDKFYKVRATACGALVNMGSCEDCHSSEFQHLAQTVLPILEKLLKDG